MGPREAHPDSSSVRCDTGPPEELGHVLGSDPDGERSMLLMAPSLRDARPSRPEDIADETPAILEQRHAGDRTRHHGRSWTHYYQMRRDGCGDVPDEGDDGHDDRQD